MNKKMLYTETARQLQFAYDERTGVSHGETDGFSCMVWAPNAQYPFQLKALFGATRNGGSFLKDEIKAMKKDLKGIVQIEPAPNSVSVLFTARKPEQAAELVTAAAAHLKAVGFTPCCQGCGKDTDAAASNMAGTYMLLCDDCYEQTRRSVEMDQSQKAAKKESVLAGVIGSVLGSLVGVVCIILLSRLGYVAALSGIAMAVCTLKGYELLGRKLSKKGVAIGSLVMLVMTYAADRLDWAVVIMQEWGLDFFVSYQLVPQLLAEGYIDIGNYWTNLAMVYAFVLLGALPIVIGAMRDQAVSRTIERFGRTV